MVATEGSRDRSIDVWLGVWRSPPLCREYQLGKSSEGVGCVIPGIWCVYTNEATVAVVFDEPPADSIRCYYC